MFEPNTLIFEFGSVRLVKQRADLVLTHQPVWSDALRSPPPEFDFRLRARGLTFDGRWHGFAAVSEWAADRHPDFDALNSYLQRYVRQTEKMAPVWEGRHEQYKVLLI